MSNPTVQRLLGLASFAPALLWVAALASACGAGPSISHTEGLQEDTGTVRGNAVGEPCITRDEEWPDFPGVTVNTTVVEYPGQGCGAGLSCVSSHFRGRVSCPAGQRAGSGDCFTTNGEPLTVPVAPQLASRPAEQGVVCSCRCAGPGPVSDLCACPTGMRCEDPFPGLVDLPEGEDDPDPYSYCMYPADGTL